MSRRYPLADLVEATGLTEAAVSRMVGLSGSTLKLARERGLTADAADRYAVRAGFSPLEVWHDYGMTLCAECEEGFAPFRSSQRFCGRRCRERNGARRRYQTRPEVAERMRAKSAAYYAEAGDYVRSRVLRYHHANRPAQLERMRAYRRDRQAKETAA